MNDQIIKRDVSNIGKNVRKTRKHELNKTQEQFAEMIDITPRNLCRIEAGQSFVASETLDKILTALNVTADILFTYEHLKDDKELLADIYTYIDKIKSNQKKLEKMYRLLRFMVEDEF